MLCEHSGIKLEVNNRENLETVNIFGIFFSDQNI